jgi:hypothetical protein
LSWQDPKKAVVVVVVVVVVVAKLVVVVVVAVVVFRVVRVGGAWLTLGVRVLRVGVAFVVVFLVDLVLEVVATVALVGSCLVV